MIDSTTNFVEHPKLVAQRIGRYADIVGRERVIAGVDCGFGTAVRTDPIVADSIVWAKLKALGEGAAIASSTAVGLEGGVMGFCKGFLAAVVADVVAAAGRGVRGRSPPASTATKIKVHPKRSGTAMAFFPATGRRSRRSDWRCAEPDQRGAARVAVLGLGRPAAIRVRISGILSRPLQRRQLRSVLDLDADRHDADLRAVKFLARS